MNADSAKLAQERAFASNVVEGTFEFQGEVYNFKATPKQETKMSDQHRATDAEWHCLKARTCGNKSDAVAYSTIHELLCRIEALENAQPAKSNHPAKPDGSLVDRVACAIYPDGSGDGFRVEAREAIREVAAWFGEQGGPIAWGWAMRLEQEAKR